MKRILLAILVLALSQSVAAQTKRAAGIGPSFKGPLALQLYSLREDLKKDVPGTLAKVRAMGFTNVEMGGYYGLTPEQFRAELDKAGLKAVSMHADFNALAGNVDKVIAEAKVFGVEFVGCAWIPHGKDFTAADVARSAEVFNRAAEKLKAAGFLFMYHIHGYEFVKDGEGTLFDKLAAATRPDLVFFQNDIFWTQHGGADPASLLLKYPKRFKLVHLKDMKKGTVGNLSGNAPDDTSVALGAGQVDLKAVLRASRKIGIKWYVVEEESPTPHENIAAGLRFLEKVRY